MTRRVPLFALLFLLAAVLWVSRLPSAAAQDTPDMPLREVSVTIPASGEVQIPFQAFCLDFGKAFPTSLGTPEGRADDNVLQALKYGLYNNLAASNPLAVNLAIWSLREGKTIAELYPDATIPAATDAQRIIDQSKGLAVDAMSGDMGVSLDEAIADGTIAVTSGDFTVDASAALAQPGDTPYHGQGTMVLRNNTAQEVRIYYPFGLILSAPSEDQQRMVTYATDLETQPMAPTTTPAPTQAATQVPAATVAPAVTDTTTMTGTTTMTNTTTTAAPTPGSVPQTGNASEMVSSNLPWLFAAVGIALLGAAGFVIARQR